MSASRSPGQRASNCRTAVTGLPSWVEKPIADDRVSGWKPPPDGRLRPLDHLTQLVRHAPVLPQPGQRLRVIGTELQQGCRDRQQRVQVEGTRSADADQRRRPRLPRLDPLAELAGQDAASLDGQRSAVQRLRDRQVEDVFLDGSGIQLPRDHARSARRLSESGDAGRWAADRQVMIEPGPGDRWSDAGPGTSATGPWRPFDGRQNWQHLDRRRVVLPGKAQIRHRSISPAGLSSTSPARCT